MTTSKRNWGALATTGLSTFAIMLALIGGAYALVLLTIMTGRISAMTVKLNALEDTNRRLSVMEGYMKTMPELTKVGNGALQQSINSNRKLDITNARLAGTTLFMRQTATKLDTTNLGLKRMGEQLVVVRSSIERMTTKLSALDEMRRLLVETNASIGKMGEGLDAMQVQLKSMNTQLAVLSDMRTSLDEMQTHLKSMNTQLATLPDVKQGLEAMQVQLKGMNTQLVALSEMKMSLGTMLTQLQAMNTALAALPEMKQDLDVMQVQLKGMNTQLATLDIGMQQMAQTTQAMAMSLKKLPMQGAFGVAVLTGAELIRK